MIVIDTLEYIMEKPYVEPNIEWYTEISLNRNVPPRCQYANVDRCPRYFHSLALLGRHGNTAIDKKEDKRLSKKWDKSGLLPATLEQETSISGPSGKPLTYARFCPEISFENFGYFAETLIRYADEIDQDSASQYLAQKGVRRGDWRWQWSNVQHMHYTECPFYSLLINDSSQTNSQLVNQNIPNNPFQATLSLIWKRHPVLRTIVIIIAVIAIICFFLFNSLPESSKESVLKILGFGSKF